ncbi:MAG: hypothetical protein K6G27_07670 [Lachnospiraceae bacterium]|nr:hypothetical protein [Lachnospiraceae bacterium]
MNEFFKDFRPIDDAFFEVLAEDKEVVILKATNIYLFEGEEIETEPSQMKTEPEQPVGGIMYMAGNLKNPDQTQTMLGNTQEYAADIEGIPLFLCVDEEGGRVARIGNNEAFGRKKIAPMAKTVPITITGRM